MTTDYRAECAQKTAALRAQCSAIVAELGDGWTVESEQLDTDGRPYFGRPLAYLTHVDGSRIMVEPDHRGRLEILGVHNYDKRVTFPERTVITVSADRPAAAIAREMTRRLLPRYAEQRAGLAARVDSANGHDDGAYRLAYSLAADLGTAKPEQNGTGQYDVRLYGRPGIHYGDMHVSGPRYVKLDITVTPDLARRLAATIADHIETDTSD